MLDNKEPTQAFSEILIDKRLLSSSLLIAQWKLSNLYLKNESRFPWLILVPRVENIEEIYQLAQNQQMMLMEEISLASKLLKTNFTIDKLNVASLGNIVPQLHVHILGRSKDDPYWPNGIWQPDYIASPYSEGKLANVILKLQNKL